MENNEQILKKIYLFSSLDESELGKISNIAKLKSVFQGDTVFQEGNEAHSLYVVKFGTLKILTNTKESGTDVGLTTISVGDHFGEMAFFDNDKRSATVEAMEKSELLEISFNELSGVLESNPSIQLKFYKAISSYLIKRVRMLTQDLSYAREIKKRFT
ncbi:MAG: cyclic nucleotide-binding domain-containing protein [Leptospira sp.]|nr:cyclic nucleotide-binding domain-containing protein [Leptospira sp.]